MIKINLIDGSSYEAPFASAYAFRNVAISMDKIASIEVVQDGMQTKESKPKGKGQRKEVI
jgi:hypothetical protein